MTAATPILSILVATDLTAGSAEAIKAAADLATVTGARLHVIHGHEESSALGGARELLVVQREVHTKRSELYDMIQSASDRRIEIASARVHMGPAAEVILQEAKSVGADLIIMGSHRPRGIADRLVGSTAEHVLRKAAVPCLILNSPLSLPVHRIVVPTDLGADATRVAQKALNWADLLCESADADVTLTHVADPMIELDGSYKFRPDLHESLRSTAQEVGRRAGWKIPIRTQILQGDDPAKEIGEYAGSIEAGLIVVGTQADPVIVRALLGSVTSALIRGVELPILVIPPAPSASGAPRAEVPSRGLKASSIAV